MAIEHKVREAHEQIKEHHTWSFTVAGYTGVASREGADGHLEISIAPEPWDRLRLGILKMYPRFLSDLEAFADEAPALLRQLAAELREALGTDDVRDWSDRMMDDHHAQVKEYVRQAVEGTNKRFQP